ncbi:MAG TPA: hypothetical protein VGB18_05545 [Candidatus Thermoplasmatota archaeon]
MDIVGPAGRALQRYTKLEARIGPYAVPLAVAALPAAALLMFFFAASISVCGEGCGLLTSLILIPFVYVTFSVFIAALALVFARRTLRRLRRDLVVTTAMRVQSLKDWFVRGDVNEPEYEALRTKMIGISEGKAPHVPAQDASAFYLRFAGVLCVTLPFALAFFFVSFLALTDGVAIAVIFALVTLIGGIANGWGIVYGFRHGKELRNAGRRLETGLLREIEASEQELLRSANRRKGGTPSSEPQPYRRATFKPFSGR